MSWASRRWERVGRTARARHYSGGGRSVNTDVAGSGHALAGPEGAWNGAKLLILLVRAAVVGALRPGGAVIES